MEWYALVILPALIFFSRIADVSLGTIRVILISRGQKNIAPLIGFFEVLIWLLAAGQVFGNLDNWYYAIVYALGFSAGTFVGLLLSERFAAGRLIVRVFTKQPVGPIVKDLQDRGYGVSWMPAEGLEGPMTLLYVIIRGEDWKKVHKLIHSHAPKAFVSTQDVRQVSEGLFPASRHFSPTFSVFRKGK